MDITKKYVGMIEAFECDFNLAEEGIHNLSEIDVSKISSDIALLRELSFLLRHGKAKIVKD